MISSLGPHTTTRIRWTRTRGRAYIYYGESNTNVDVTITGANKDDNLGFSVSDAGNFNGDSYDDVIVGVPGYDSSNGRAYIYYGNDPMDNGIDVTLTGESASGDKFGHSVSTAGNIDNDNYDDVVVGAPNNGAGGSNAGRVFIYYGESSADAREEIMMTGVVVSSTGEQLGFAVSDAGDVNGDNYADVITGAPYWTSNSGRIKLWGNPS
ncbi:MAG: integrin alpha [Thermoplasmata archaeon]